MEQIIVEAAPRETRGKNAARRVRLTGQVPAVIYGGKGESQALEVNAKQLSAILRSASGHNTIFKIKVKGTEETAIVKDWLVDPVKGHLLHVDLLRIAMDVRMRVKIPVHTFGEAQGVKLQGGVFEMVTREVEIECLPGDIPDHIDVDVTALVFGQVLRVSDLPRDPKIKFVTDETQPVAHITSVKEVVEAAPAEAGAEVAAAAPAEPEVIKKGKQETEEGAAEGGKTEGGKAEGGKKVEGKK